MTGKGTGGFECDCDWAGTDGVGGEVELVGVERSVFGSAIVMPSVLRSEARPAAGWIFGLRKREGGCGHEFCWMCKGDWSKHGSATGGYYQCTR